MPELTPSANTSVNQLSQYIERIERLEEEKRAHGVIYTQRLARLVLSPKLCVR